MAGMYGRMLWEHRHAESEAPAAPRPATVTVTRIWPEDSLANRPGGLRSRLGLGVGPAESDLAVLPEARISPGPQQTRVTGRPGWTDSDPASARGWLGSSWSTRTGLRGLRVRGRGGGRDTHASMQDGWGRPGATRRAALSHGAASERPRAEIQVNPCTPRQEGSGASKLVAIASDWTPGPGPAACREIYGPFATSLYLAGSPGPYCIA
jgi:hypothetical protein